MKALLKRTYGEKQTLGTLTLTGKKGIVFECCTLELPWKDNKRNISCIPPGIYQVIRRDSPQFREHYYIAGVPDRDFILIHPGNFYTQIRGCVLVGDSYQDINKDRLKDLINSRKTMDELLRIAPGGFDLEIR